MCRQISTFCRHKNFPRGNLLLVSVTVIFESVILIVVLLLGSEEFPTLLHFAAKYGFDKLVWQLLECPGGDEAVKILNCNDHNPAELAEISGHTKVANTIRGYTVSINFDIIKVDF